MQAEPDAEDSNLEDRISAFLIRNFPQIAMHGGAAGIEGIDHETGEVWIQLGGACSGCGISPMTIQAIKHRMVEEIPEISEVHADVGGGMAPGFPGEDDWRPDASDAPF